MVRQMKKQSSNGSSKNADTTSVSESSAISAVDSSFPNSKKIYVSGKTHPDVKVPFREISLAPTKTMSGEIEINGPVRVYDTSGPWGDPSVTLDPVQGLPALRRDWILKRGDVEEIDGRKVQPIDDGYLSVSHAEHSAKRNGSASPARTDLAKDKKRNRGQSEPDKINRDDVVQNLFVPSGERDHDREHALQSNCYHGHARARIEPRYAFEKQSVFGHRKINARRRQHSLTQETQG